MKTKPISALKSQKKIFLKTCEKAFDQIIKLTEDQKRDLENYMTVSLFQAKTLDLVKKAVAA